ncbi:MAG: FAD-dependent oxidoreductase [Myxococcales bacterium]|nr:FAD-dependent oxidoreductase [Myxococcales bacterium]
MDTPYSLPAERLEVRLPDAKPKYTSAEARAEAERCLYCHDAPCIEKCPTEINIPEFIHKIASGNTLGAARTILAQNILGYTCARVCPVEVLCVGACVYNEWHKTPIAIGRLQRYATESLLEHEALTGQAVLRPKTPTEGRRKVALVGAGPASLACAAYLALEGHEAVIYERGALPGGLNTTGVAPYKLHSEDSLREVAYVQSLGVTLKTGVEVGRDLSASSLLNDHDAVFLGMGLGADARLSIADEAGPGVWGATALIEKIKNDASFKLPAVKRATVVGGGNTAIDIARELAQLGVAEVVMVYRRGAEHMSGYKHEMDLARKEGIRLVGWRQPVAVLRDAAGGVSGLRLRDTQQGGEETLSTELVVLAIGQEKIKGLTDAFGGIALDQKGCVVADAKTRQTSNPKVYAGGDCINGGKEVVNAVADGRDAARAMIQRWFAA